MHGVDEAWGKMKRMWESLLPEGRVVGFKFWLVVVVGRRVVGFDFRLVVVVVVVATVLRQRQQHERGNKGCKGLSISQSRRMEITFASYHATIIDR